MKKVFILVLFLLFGCGYSIVKVYPTQLDLVDVRSSVTSLPGIEADITGALIDSLSSKGVVFKKKCPYVHILFNGISSKDYFYQNSGGITRIRANASFKVKIEFCDKKVKSRVFSIPFIYHYYSSPQPTEASQRRNILKIMDILSDNILEMIHEHSSPY